MPCPPVPLDREVLDHKYVRACHIIYLTRQTQLPKAQAQAQQLIGRSEPSMPKSWNQTKCFSTS